MFRETQIRNVIAMFYNQKEKNILQKYIAQYNKVSNKEEMILLINRLILTEHNAPKQWTYERILQGLKYGHPELTAKAKNLINSINVRELLNA